MAIPLDQVRFLQVDRGKSMKVYTEHDESYVNGACQYWIGALKPHGFVQADRDKIVNLRLIKHIDHQFKRAFFVTNPGEQDMSCEFSDPCYKQIVKLLGQEKERREFQIKSKLLSWIH